MKTNKSNVIHFCLRQRGIQTIPVVMVDDVLIEDTDSTKFLGIYLDRGLTWNNHIDHVCSKVTSGIYVLRNLVYFCSAQVLRMAYFGLIYPHLEYGTRGFGAAVLDSCFS